MTVMFKISEKYPVHTSDSGNVVINEEKLDKFWENNGLGDKKGVYVLAMRSGKGGIIPYYVGKASKSFKKEAFSPRNRGLYAKVIGKYGKPYMYFIWTNKAECIKELEKEMIQLAYIRNPHLINKQNIKPKWSVEGTINGTKRGKPPKEISEFKKMIGLT